MKNVTITLDDETHRNARIRAAEMGTSLSALVKTYLESLAAPEAAPSFAGVREMHSSYLPQPASLSAKFPRKPGALRGMWIADDFDEWSDDIQKSFDAWDHDDTSPQ